LPLFPRDLILIRSRIPMQHHNATPYLILVSRLVLFLLFQSVIALWSSWETSQRYWVLSATATNIVSITLLYSLFRAGQRSFLALFRPDLRSWKKDLLIFSGAVLIALPVTFLFDRALARLIWDDPTTPVQLMFAPIDPLVAGVLVLLFPVTIALAELSTYFMYVMPRLKRQMNNGWAPVLLPVVFLSLQHCTLPFIPDMRFILYRSLVFLPFAAVLGVAIHKRPSLFVYFAILHGLMDLGTVMMFFRE
jgi:hypothetical protein